MLNSAEPFSYLVSVIDQRLRSTLEPPSAILADFYGMMRYHLGWMDKEFNELAAPSGKYVRPLLTLLSCLAAGGQIEQAVPAAVAVELIHNFSLVHDDIEDGSDFRRHRPTVWKLWGDAQAINVGDGLFALAHFQMSRLGESGVEPRRIVAATSIVDQACIALTEGQFLDLLFETMNQVSLDEYLWMIRGKTAALLACACELGAVVATDDVDTRASLHGFGHNLGMAFQIEDDILGIWGEPTVTGKPSCSDVLSQKKTLPVVYAWDRGCARDLPSGHRDAAQALLEMYSSESVSETDVGRVLQALETLGARAYCHSLSREYTARALNALASAPLIPTARGDLESMAKTLLERSH